MDVVDAYTPYRWMKEEQDKRNEERDRRIAGENYQRQKDIMAAQAAQQEAARQSAFNRFTQWANPYMQSAFASPSASAPGNATYGPEIAALEESIKAGEAQAQGSLASQLARRGIYQSGPSAAASAKLTADTQSNIAQAKADYAQEIERRKQNERMASQDAFSRMFASYASQF